MCWLLCLNSRNWGLRLFPCVKSCLTARLPCVDKGRVHASVHTALIASNRYHDAGTQSYNDIVAIWLAANYEHYATVITVSRPKELWLNVWAGQKILSHDIMVIGLQVQLWLDIFWISSIEIFYHSWLAQQAWFCDGTTAMGKAILQNKKKCRPPVIFRLKRCHLP